MEERFMPARIIPNSQGGMNNTNNNMGNKQPQIGAPKVEMKAPEVKAAVKEEIRASIAQVNDKKNFSNMDRAQFYAGHDRLDLQGPSVQRVRELQEENDHLQREISAKENEVAECTDPLALLADIEHRKIIIARNTGEILKIYLRNEERIKRIQELESHNARIQKEMMDMQGKFIWTKDMEEKTKFASEFFVLKSEIENNLKEINELNKK